MYCAYRLCRGTEGDNISVSSISPQSCHGVTGARLIWTHHNKAIAIVADRPGKLMKGEATSLFTRMIGPSESPKYLLYLTCKLGLVRRPPFIAGDGKGQLTEEKVSIIHHKDYLRSSSWENWWMALRQGWVFELLKPLQNRVLCCCGYTCRTGWFIWLAGGLCPFCARLGANSERGLAYHCSVRYITSHGSPCTISSPNESSWITGPG